MVDNIGCMRTLMTPSQRQLLAERLKGLGIRANYKSMESLSAAVAKVLEVPIPDDVSDRNSMVKTYYLSHQKVDIDLKVRVFKPMNGYSKRMNAIAALAEGIR